MHPDLARGLGIAEGDPVCLTTRRGELVLPARITRDIRLDTVFVPFHWGGRASVNMLTKAALDPVSRIPEFKACAVHVAKAAAPRPHSASPGTAQVAEISSSSFSPEVT
jgi:assimilatory nitrate reductase catalytic subunit